MSEPTKKSSAGKWLFILLGAVILALAIIYFICTTTKSEGEQAGVLLNFSQKGIAIKTYEGELNKGGVGNVSNTAQFNEVFKFSVTSKAVADSLMQYNGKKVSVHFHEVVHSFFWQGETNIIVDGVREINQ